nr:unnamed protein product [Rangifer tarandus platyrhynchus]
MRLDLGLRALGEEELENRAVLTPNSGGRSLPEAPWHLIGQCRGGGSRHQRARRELGREPGLPGWKGQGRLARLAARAGSRDYARRRGCAPVCRRGASETQDLERRMALGNV